MKFRDFQDNYMVALSVEDLDGLWVHIQNTKLEEKYPIKVKALKRNLGVGKLY